MTRVHVHVLRVLWRGSCVFATAPYSREDTLRRQMRPEQQVRESVSCFFLVHSSYTSRSDSVALCANRKCGSPCVWLDTRRP